MIHDLIEKLEHFGNERRRVRRKLCSIIREHQEVFVSNRWLARKIHGRYLGDLSDSELVFYAKELDAKLSGELQDD